ncbi:MAG: PfkB family carbohydrate kinase, partial [Syntrophales bacterium]|nr:PfkB family carbohydrate kinase [Syntrophales bacterium]
MTSREQGMKGPARVVALGQCSLDYLGKITAYPQPNTKCEFTGMVIEGGGPAASASVALSRWGIPCSFCGIVGDDPFGVVITESLAQEGIDTE